MVLLSPGLPETPAPIQTLLLPVASALPALAPTPTLFEPLLLKSAKNPLAVLELPVVLPLSASLPTAVLNVPAVLLRSA